MRTFRHYFMVAAIICTSTSVMAGVYMKAHEKDSNGTIDTRQEMFIEDDRLRMNMNSRGQNLIFIFRADKQLFWMLNPAKKRYFEMTEKSIQEMMPEPGSSPNQLMQQYSQYMTPEQQQKMKEAMEKAKEGMTDEQRRMMEQHLNSPTPTGLPPTAMSSDKTVYRKLGSAEKVNAWQTHHYEGERGGKVVKQLWTADLSTLGVSRDDLNAFNEMAKFMESVKSEWSQGDDFADFEIGSPEWEAQKGYRGVPVKIVRMKHGMIDNTFMVEEVKQQDHDGDLFEIPSDFTAGNMFDLMR